MLSKYYATLMLVFLTRQTKSIRVDMGSDLNNYNTQYIISDCYYPCVTVLNLSGVFPRVDSG